MAQVDVKIKTQKRPGQVRGGFPSIEKAVSSNSAAASYNYARRTVTFAKKRAHVITGHMKNSIRHEKISYGRHKVVVGAHYGVYEEYGTRHRPPHPFFRPAIRDARTAFLLDMQKVFKVGGVTHR